MNEEVIAFQGKFAEVARDCQRFCYMTRAKELQEEARDKLSGLHNEAHNLKLDLIESRDEDAANAMLSFEQIITTLSSELNMWIALKEDNPAMAWEFLVNAQSSALTALQVHTVGSQLTGHIEYLNILEQVLFPPLMFFSVGMIVKDAECSICGEEYGECDHIKGRAYMGEQCYRIIKEADLLEASTVEKPANKLCRIISYTGNDGVKRDVLTWRVIAEEPDQDKDNV